MSSRMESGCDKKNTEDRRQNTGEFAFDYCLCELCALSG